MSDLTCEQFQESSAELALGVLQGRARADAIAHVEQCRGCQHDLMLMGEVADRLVELTPSAEPPAGLETAVLRRLTPQRGRLRRQPVLRLAVAAVLAVAIGVGGWTIGHRGVPPMAAAAGPDKVVTAALVAGGRPIGQVVATGGRHPWVAMAVDTSLGNRSIECILLERNGAKVAIGTFALANGYGYWSAPIPAVRTQVTGAQLVDSGGQTVATAMFAAASL